MVVTMDKVSKQIQLNVALIFFSCVVIFIARSIALGEIATLRDCIGADIVFTMITSLATTGAWRIVEKIEGNLLYNVFLLISLAIFSIIYGAAIVTNSNEVVFTFIMIGIVLFVIIYVIENIIIIRHFRSIQVDVTDYGYKKES